MLTPPFDMHTQANSSICFNFENEVEEGHLYVSYAYIHIYTRTRNKKKHILCIERNIDLIEVMRQFRLNFLLSRLNNCMYDYKLKAIKYTTTMNKTNSRFHMIIILFCK